MKDLTVFLIDDDTDDQEIFIAVFGTIAPHAKIVTAANGQAALAKLVSKEVLPDIIFLDLNMPLMNGRQFLKEVIKLDDINRIPIVILTTSSDQATRASVMDLGAKDFVTKPDKFSDWEATLNRVLKFLPSGNPLV